MKWLLILLLLSGCVQRTNYSTVDMIALYYVVCDKETGIEYFTSRRDHSLFVRYDSNGLPKKCGKTKEHVK